MKFATLALILSAVSLTATAAPVSAQTIDLPGRTNIELSEIDLSKLDLSTPYEGQVEAVNDNIVTFRTVDGMLVNFAVDPSVVTAYDLEPGTQLVVDLSDLRIGYVEGLAPYSVDVQFPDGSSENFYIVPEGRKTLTYGDTVWIRPGGRVEEIDSIEDIPLSALNVRPVTTIAAAPPVVVETAPPVVEAPPVQQPTTPQVITPVQPEPTVTEPVRALW